MRILLAQNSLYYPAHGGGDKSNRLLMEALAARGHACRAVARIPVFGAEGQARYLAELESRGVAPDRAALERGAVEFERGGVEVRVAADTSLRAYFLDQLQQFHPEVILASTDDPAQLLLDAALRFPGARVVYLARATLALPFGPDCAFPSESKADRIRAAARMVGVSEYVARYARTYGGVDAVHVPISLPDPGPWPALGRFGNEFITMVNPCAVKGIAIFLALADAFPEARFAAVPTWGTNQVDRAALAARPNITLLDPVDNIDRLLERTRILLVPSLWAEARSRIIVEAMLRGVPVLASDVGGIPEAKLGVPYLLPVEAIEHYRPEVDEQMVPVAETPPQDIRPWREALGRVLADPVHYAEISRASLAAAVEYAARATVEPFEALLEAVVRGPARSEPAAPPQPKGLESLSLEKRRLLALRLRDRAPSAAWFPGADVAGGMRLFCFPHAGGGAAAFAGWKIEGRDITVCPVRLPGREARAAEAPFERMAPLVEALATAIAPYLDRPFAFFGHSMGAVAAFELARLLRKRGSPMPAALIASGARAPQFRRNFTPPPDPPEADFLAELRRLGGLPAEALDDPAVLRAIMPALTADASLYRHYVYAEDAPLGFPIRAYGGEADANIREGHLEAWSEQTAVSFAVRKFPSGHFFLQSARAEVLAALALDLGAL